MALFYLFNRNRIVHKIPIPIGKKKTHSPVFNFYFDNGSIDFNKFSNLLFSVVV